MAKKARRIRYVPRARRRRHKKNPIMGIPNIVWLLGGAAAAFFVWKKMRPAGTAAAKPTVAELAAKTAAAAAQAAVTKSIGDDLYSDVGGSLSSGGLGSLG